MSQSSARPEIVLVAHNIRSLHNVGSLFRTCDGAGVQKIYLTGFSGYPPRKEISKTALGAEESVAWEQSWEIEPVLSQLQAEGYTLVAVEQDANSLLYDDAQYPARLAVILGNEVWGLEPEVLEKCAFTIHIPMYGEKASLNVAVCGGVVLYGIQQRVRQVQQAAGARQS